MKILPGDVFYNTNNDSFYVVDDKEVARYFPFKRVHAFGWSSWHIGQRLPKQYIRITNLR